MSQPTNQLTLPFFFLSLNSYMSPEVANKKRYNQGADVFSYGMVLYEILSLNQPVVAEGRKTVDPEHLRMCPCWPDSIKHLLFRTWSPGIGDRPTMKEVCIVLKRKIAELRCGDSTGLDIPEYAEDIGQKVHQTVEVVKRFTPIRITDEATIGTSSTGSHYSCTGSEATPAPSTSILGSLSQSNDRSVVESSSRHKGGSASSLLTTRLAATTAGTP